MGQSGSVGLFNSGSVKQLRGQVPLVDGIEDLAGLNAVSRLQYLQTGFAAQFFDEVAVGSKTGRQHDGVCCDGCSTAITVDHGDAGIGDRFEALCGVDLNVEVLEA